MDTIDVPLSAYTDNAGVANVNVDELPTRMHAFTPDSDVSVDYDRQLKLLFKKLAIIHALNDKGDGTGFCNHPDSVIRLTILQEHHDKIFTKQYRTIHSLHDAIDAVVKRWYATGKTKLAPKNCKFNTPIIPVPKKDETGKMTKARVCGDLRKLNLYVVEDDKFQLPFIPDVLAAFAGGQLFGEYDLSEAYFQFRLADESQQYTAFTWDNIQYVFVGCPFGIKHLPSVFQRFMCNLFKDMPFVMPYIDNIGFASKSWDEHYQHAYAIMERLNSVNLRVNPSSYNLGNTRMRVLGHVISAQGVALDPEKTEMIHAWPLPLDGSSMASVLGLGAFLRDHIRHYADITAPLEPLKKQKVIEWNDNLKRHWDLFKRAFANAPILSFPNFDNKFVMAHDASQTGVGGVLYQPNDADNTITAHNIIAICSKQLNGTQRNYPVYKKELFGMIYCLRKFHQFIYGHRDVLALTDHKPLIHILSQRTMTVALQQWVDVLLDYDLTVQYRPGILHIIPDALSRMYASTYQDPNITWGTIDNIRILENFNKVSSPSDFLCEQSLNEIKPLSTVRRRHRSTDVNHIYNVQHKSQGRINSDNTSTPTSINSNDDDDMNTEAMIAYMKRIYMHDEHTHVHDEQPDLYLNAVTCLEEFQYATIAAPLYHCTPISEHRASLAMKARCSRMHESQYEHDRAYSKAIQVSLLKNKKKNENNKVYNNDIESSTKLTDEEKLLIAYDKRGKKSPSDTVRTKLLSDAHTGHFGEKHMSYYIQREGYWWPHMRNDIASVIDACNDCRRYNAEVHGYHPARSVHANLPGDHYQIDLAQFVKSIDGYVYCLLCVDVFTGFIMLKPLIDKSAASVANALWQIFSVIGVPKILQSDNGSEFKNEVINALTRILGIPHRFISEYNPRADGKVERAVRTVKVTVMKLLHGATIYWPYHLPFVQYSYNDKISSLTGSTPFSLMYGRAPNSCRDYTADEQGDMPMDIQAWVKHRDDILSLIYPSISKRASQQQAQYSMKIDNNRRRLIREQIQIGTQVMLKDPKYINNHSKAAHEPTYIGPYTIVKVNKHGTYAVKDGLNNVLNRHIPIDQLKVLQPDISKLPINDAVKPSSQVDTNSDDNAEYEIESIIKHRVSDRGELEYMVKWKGWPLSKATWENEQQFVDTAIIDRYYRELSIKSLTKRGAIAHALSTKSYRIASIYPQ